MVGTEVVEDNLTLTTLNSNAYSFYLNVVVLNHKQTASGMTPSKASDDEDDKKGSAVLAKSQKSPNIRSPPSRLAASLLEKAPPHMRSSIDKSLLSTAKAMSKTSIAMSEGMSKTSIAMSKMTSDMSKTSQAVKENAVAFVASKTMVARAVSTLNKCLPSLIESTGLDLTVSSRFTQGSVSVLQVDLKATDLPRYVEVTRGDDAADQFRNAMDALKALGATESIGSLEKEMLPQVRSKLMEILSTRLVTSMKEMEGALEVECIALEDNEEARWLFTFMEFQSQMK